MKICEEKFMSPWRKYENFHQLMATSIYIGSNLILQTVGIIAMVSFLFTRFYFLSLFYISWLIYDRNTCNRGGRYLECVSNWSYWKYFKDYFPVKLIKTCHLPANRNYIMGYHPHGIYCIGATPWFMNRRTDFNEVFPGLTPRMLSLNIQFFLPLHREYILSLGICAASKEGIEWLLTQEGLGNALVIAIGGVQESLECQPGTAILVLKHRKGFVKLALKHGASLVPTFAFGEIDIFSVVKAPQGSVLRKLQNIIKKIFSYCLPIFYGRSFLFLKTLIPFKRPITIVVGSPIHLEKVDEPTDEQVNSVHGKYMESLIDLIEQHKEKYDPNLQFKII